MRRILLAVLFGTTTAGVAATSSCAMPAADCASDGTCANAATPGSDGGNGSETSTSSSSGSSGTVGDGSVEAAAPPPNCDVTADSKTTAAAACVDNGYAVFVDANATTGGDGTKEKPVQTISAALALAVPNGKQRIYVCGTSTFAEHVNVTAQNAARLIGGFDCTKWLPLATGMVPKVAPGDTGYALQVTAVASNFTIEDMSFEAIKGTATSPSSIAVFVASSPNVTFTRLTITANDAFAGMGGKAGTTGLSNPTDGTGNVGTTTAGGSTKTCTCSTGDTTVGGKGGDVTAATHDGAPGLPSIQPSAPPASNGAPGTNLECNTGSSAGAAGGSAGPNGADAVKPSALGLLDALGWHPSAGDAGKNGSAGQGGGGGGSLTVGDPTQTGGGGGGGCGGCGGGAGTGGGGGGASIGLVAFQSAINLVSCRVTAAQAGDGGPGQIGAGGASGGGHGNGFQQACFGARGGPGGSGGAGAGGAGGIGAAVLYSGGPPVTDPSTTLTAGKHGLGGGGGAPTMNAGLVGIDGAAIPAP